jgi:hypothetical protein
LTGKSLAPPSTNLTHVESTRPQSRGHSRRRSQTTTAATIVADQLRAAQDTLKTASQDKMGNEQSSQKGHHKDHLKEKLRSSTPPAASSTHEKQSSQQQSPPPPQQTALPPPPQPIQPEPSPQTTLPIHVPSTVSRDEPQGSRTEGHQALVSSIDPADASQEYMVSSPHFSRPPRLPLPIEEELHTPGSPIISAQDLPSPSILDPNEVDGILPRRSSIVSSVAADDDDLGDEFKGPSGRPTVPTLIEWEGPGERVYVTGTFTGWNKKYKLLKGGPSPKKDALSAYVNITPGTHHLMFLVDNDMRTSDYLPTAVDYTNILVNYIEVSYEDIPKPKEGVDGKDGQAATPSATTDAPNDAAPATESTPADEPTVKAPVPEPKKEAPPEPAKKYHQKIPRYLLDLDSPEESDRFGRANATTNNLPVPPSLPSFLGKSILNGTTPMKDDSSVLIHPNHTVLNHLATSSIKDNILATSATTRYKQKFLTTIMYKPKEEHPDRVY